MTLKPIVGSVVGPTSSTHWGQVLQTPRVYGVVEVAYEDGSARAKGVHLLSTLSDSLTDVTPSLHGIETIAKNIHTEGIETILLCVPVGHIVYIVLRGGGSVYLKRGVQFARLLSAEGGISGEIQPGDTIILASREFSRVLSKDEAAAVFDHLTPSEVAEKLTLLLHAKPYGEGSAALVMQFSNAEIEDDAAPAVTPIPASPLTRAKVLFTRARRHASFPVLAHDLKRLKSHPKKAKFFLTAFLIGVFALAVLLGIWKQTTQRASPAVVATISDARHALEEGVALLSLNPVKGRERLVTAKGLLEPLVKSVSPRSEVGREIAQLMQQVTDNLTQSMQITTTKPELFFDAALVKKGANIASMGLEGTTMGLIDTVTQTVIALDTTSKKATVLGGGQAYAGMSRVAIHGDALYVLTDAGVNRVRLTDKQTVQSVVKKDSQWGTIASVVSFGGNIYLLDTQKSRIWKYVATETGFSDLREYLNPDTLPDLSQTNSLAIDGSVWLGSGNGRLWKFTGGKEDTFVAQGVDPAFGKHVMIYTSDTANNLYVLDGDNKRVVVLEKDGTYLAQYAWSEPLMVTELAISEQEKKIYLLADGKLYTIGLK